MGFLCLPAVVSLQPGSCMPHLVSQWISFAWRYAGITQAHFCRRTCYRRPPPMRHVGGTATMPGMPGHKLILLQRMLQSGDGVAELAAVLTDRPVEIDLVPTRHVACARHDWDCASARGRPTCCCGRWCAVFLTVRAVCVPCVFLGGGAGGRRRWYCSTAAPGVVGIFFFLLIDSADCVTLSCWPPQ